MKLFKTFRLDTENHLLWRHSDRIAIAPKGFDVLAYLVEHAERVVTQDEILDALWPETHVNPEVLRKYILEIRKALGDRPETPEFIETVPKRGYRFVAPVMDESAAERPDVPSSGATEEHPIEKDDDPATAPSEQEVLFAQRRLLKLAIMAMLAVVAAAGLSGYFLLARNGRNAHSVTGTSIAVLPFADVSPAKDQQYLSDGLAEQLINDLAKVPGLKVIGRSSSFHFRDSSEDARDVGRKLAVANVLEGSVRREGNHVRITTELIKVDDGFQLWSETYDREINDIFAVQDEIARAATEALQPKLLEGDGQPVASVSRSTNPEAYQAYLEAKYFIGRGASKEDLGKALAYTDTAIKFDERYAPAWALRSSVQNVMATVSLIDVTEGFRRARDDAERAIALAPTFGSAYLALARTQIFYDWDWDAANTCLTKAAALEPGNAEIFQIHSRLSALLGNLDEAVNLGEQSVTLDPLDTISRLQLGYVLYVGSRYDAAQVELQKALDLNPQAGFVHVTLGKILMAEAKPQQALAEIEKEPNDWARLTASALVYHMLGREQDSNAALASLIAKHDTDSAYQIAEVYAFREESDKAFQWLERAYEQRDAGLPEIKTDPLVKSLRHDPRYTALLKRMRLLT
jgi:TolB-like protein/DNA-binding winged helix-turn-helix (wHTH) protein/Tfp pilus assembly protein PilF